MANAQNAAQTDAKADEKVEAKSASPASLKEKYNEAIKSPLYSAEVKKVAAGVYEMFSAVSTDDKRRELLDAIASAANGRDQTVLTAAYEELQALNKAHAHNNKALNEVRAKYSFEEIVQVYSEDFMKLAYQVSYEVLRHSSELKLAAGSGEKRGRKTADGSAPPAGDGTGKKAAKKTTVYHIEGPNGLKLDMKFKSGPKKYDVNEIPLLDAIGIKYTKAENGKPVVENGPTSRKLADAILAGEHKGFSATTEVIDAPQNEPEEA